ncbi:hypothetical protein ACEWPN_21775 [Yoonia sp. R2-816]
MMYLLLIAGCLLLLFRGPKLRKQARLVLGLLFVGLLFLWGSYFAWSNPSGDPQGGMFRGIDLMALLIITALFGLTCLTQIRRSGGSAHTAQSRPILPLAAIVILGAACFYFTLAYFL